MSFTLVKPYFRTACEAVSLRKHPDPFNENNIPSTIIDYSYQLNFNSPASLRKFNQNDLELDCPIEVIFYVKGYRDPDLGQDQALAKAEELILQAETAALRLGTCIKNVIFQTMRTEQLATSNDNVIRVRLTFNTITSLAI